MVPSWAMIVVALLVLLPLTIALASLALTHPIPVLLVTILVVLVWRKGGSQMSKIGRYRVPNNKVGIVRRNYGQADPTFRHVAPHDTVGLQARTLLPNRIYWLAPGVYTVEYVDVTHIPNECIGVVTALEGRHRPRDQVFGRHVACDNFQDGPAFLDNGGEQGPQVATLAGGQTYYINTRLFKVEIVPRTKVPIGTIGLVTALAGRIPGQGSRFGKHVECDNFQDGQRFLYEGGEQGRQLAVLTGGTYDINPLLFSVTTTGNVKNHAAQGLTADHLMDVHVPVDKTGVVVTLDGCEPERNDGKTVGPRIVGHQNFRLPWEFLRNGGTRGVQEETVNGMFSLNPWFVRVVAIPTRVLILEWSKKTATEAVNNYDAKLDPIVVTIQGYRLHVDITQTLRIPESSAPRLVSEFGDNESSSLGGLEDKPLPIQRFVERVLGATVEGYFNQIAAESTVNEFLRRYSEIRIDLATQVRNELAEWGVDAVDTTLASFEAEDPKLNEALQEEATGQIREAALKVEFETIQIEDRIDEVRVRAEQRRAALKLEAELNLQMDTLGRNNTAMIHMIREITKMQVPNYIGGGDVATLVQALPTTTLQNLIGQLNELKPVTPTDNTHPQAELRQDPTPPADPNEPPESN